MPNYFYGPQAEQFAFYRIPKALFTDPAYRSISTDAKVLYGLLLDRMSLSARNDWLDEQGRVYIIFTVEEIMENLAFIQRTMQLNRELIARLQQQLKTNTSASSKLKATLEATIEGLNAELEAKNKQIADLTAELEQKNLYIAKQGEQITSLNKNVSDLTAQNEAKTRTMAAQDKEIHTGWYVFGTKRELKEQNILQRGDVLRSDQFNKDYFTRVDIRVDKVIKLYSKSAKLLTNHPAGSYSLDRDSQGQYTLRITNPQEFWRASRYLVIVVK